MIAHPEDNQPDGTRNPAPRSLSSISIISFNARKRWETVSTVLDKYAGYVDIIMFQEPAWRGVRTQPSTTSRMGDVAFGPPIHFSWKSYSESFDNRDESRPGPRVLTYINKRLDIFRPQLRTDIIKHRDISLVTLYINHPRDTTPHEFNILNVYNDGHTQAALHELEQVSNIFPKISICTRDFNIQDREWDEGAVSHYAPDSNYMRLKDVLDFLELEYVYPSNGGAATHIPDQPEQRPSVIDLVFASADMRNQQEFRYAIKEDDAERWGSDHRMLKIEVPFLEGEPEVDIKTKIDAWSEEEDDYVSQVSGEMRDLAREAIDTEEELIATMERVTTILERAWTEYSEEKSPSKHGKVWWNKDCKQAYQEMRLNGGPRNPLMRVGLKRTIRKTKRAHFDNKIKQMASTNNRPWDLMPWARERKLPATEAILNNQGESCNNTDMLFDTLHSTYNSANNRNVNLARMTKELTPLPERGWNPFSRQELVDALKSCAKNTAPGPDHVSWRLIKRFIKSDLGVGE
jgi:hypothetical protein